MGQRLVVTIRSNEEDLAKIYYHWGAYTEPALMHARDILDCIYNGKDESIREFQLRLIRWCENNGGGIDGGGKSDEFKRIQNMFPNETFETDDYSRNDGLSALSEEGMEYMQGWSEGDITINLDDEVIYNEVMWSYECFEEYKESRKEWDDEFDEGMTINDVPEIKYDLYEIPFENINDVIHELDKVTDCFIRHGNEIYELIE